MARANGREVSLCGDLAGDPRTLPALLGCGLRTLSVAPAALAASRRPCGDESEA